MYSAPGRLVQVCLHVTEPVWHPMHLSRFITIATCTMNPIASAPSGAGSSDPHLLRAPPHHDELVALRPGRPVVVEAVGELAVAADDVGGLDGDAGRRVVRPAVPAGDLRARGHEVPVLGVVHEHRAGGH